MESLFVEAVSTRYTKLTDISEPDEIRDDFLSLRYAGVSLKPVNRTALRIFLEGRELRRGAIVGALGSLHLVHRIRVVEPDKYFLQGQGRANLRPIDEQIIWDLVPAVTTNYDARTVVSRPEDFTPSKKLIKFVKDAIEQHRREDEALSRQALELNPADMGAIPEQPNVFQETVETNSDVDAATLLTVSIRRFLVTLADSIEASNERGRSLTEKKKFRPEIARAILYRIPINPGDTTPFLETLCHEIWSVAEIGLYGNDSFRLIVQDEELTVAPASLSLQKDVSVPTASNWITASVRKRSK